jgi:hypothetical protein
MVNDSARLFALTDQQWNLQESRKLLRNTMCLNLKAKLLHNLLCLLFSTWSHVRTQRQKGIHCSEKRNRGDEVCSQKKAEIRDFALEICGQRKETRAQREGGRGAEDQKAKISGASEGKTKRRVNDMAQERTQGGWEK